MVFGTPDAGDSCLVPDFGSLTGGVDDDGDDLGAPDDDGFDPDSDLCFWAGGVGDATHGDDGFGPDSDPRSWAGCMDDTYSPGPKNSNVAVAMLFA